MLSLPLHIYIYIIQLMKYIFVYLTENIFEHYKFSVAFYFLYTKPAVQNVFYVVAFYYITSEKMMVLLRPLTQIYAVQMNDKNNKHIGINFGIRNTITLVLLNPDIPCLSKQCRSRSVGFFRSQLIWICTVCHSVFEFVSTTWIK